jgi:hypothetical protein
MASVNSYRTRAEVIILLLLPTLNVMSDAPTKQKLWGGRFTGTTDPLYAYISYLFSVVIDWGQNACI